MSRRDVYNQTGQGYESGRYGDQHMDWYRGLRNRVITTLLDDSFGDQGLRIIEVGCGTGLTLDYLARHHPRHVLFGTDFSETMLAQAATKARQLPNAPKLSLGDAGRLPYADATFDVLIATRFIHQFSQERKREIWQEFRRVVRPGGMLIVEFYARPYHWIRYWIGGSKGRSRQGYFDHYPSSSEVRDVVGAQFQLYPLRLAGSRLLGHALPELFVNRATDVAGRALGGLLLDGTSLQPDASAATEAAELFDLVVDNAPALRDARLGPRFRLGQAGFVLFRRARNTIYRVSGRTEWYLKLTSEGNAQVMEHERLGAAAIDQAFGGHPDYRGAPLTRVSLDPPFVLASSIPGEAMNTLFFKECWTPGGAAAVRLERTFHLLGSLLAVLHQGAEVPVTPATTRPFKVLDTLLSQVREPDAVIDAIGSWQDRHRQSDEGDTFQHGNFRLDNIIRSPKGLGFIDLENCGSGMQYQDLSRPVLDLVLSRALPLFPWSRAERCLSAFLSGYSQTREIDAVQLWKLVAVRLSRYYVEAHAKRSRISFGGLPVSRSKLARLVVAFLRSELDGFHAIQPGNA